MSLVCDCYEEVDEQCLGRYIKAVWQNMSRLKILFHIMVMNTFRNSWISSNRLVVRVKVSASKGADTGNNSGQCPLFQGLQNKGVGGRDI